VAQCDISDFDLEVEEGLTIKVFVIRPKTLAKKDNACEIHAHGGGAVMLDAEMFNPVMAGTASRKNCVLFNVDYRKGPEYKCPKG